MLIIPDKKDFDMNIDKLIEDVIAIEGDYSNHPADRDGPTRWGRNRSGRTQPRLCR